MTEMTQGTHWGGEPHPPTEMGYANRNELVIDIVHAFITQVAPEELSRFSRLSRLYRENPENITRPKSEKDDMLGFGLGEVEHILTPLVMTIVTEVLIRLTDPTVDTLLAKGKNALRRFFRKPPPPQPVPNFTPERFTQLREVIDKTFDEIEGFESLPLSNEQKKILKAMFIEKLATTQS